MKKVANKLRASGQIQDKDRYISILEAKKQMVAMLTEIQLDIQEVNTAPQFLTDDNVKDFRECVDTIIQQKINALKGE